MGRSESRIEGPRKVETTDRGTFPFSTGYPSEGHHVGGTRGAAHEAVAAQRRESGAAGALLAKAGPANPPAYIEGLAEEFATRSREAIELTGDPNATMRWYGATVRHAKDMAAAFGLPDMGDKPTPGVSLPDRLGHPLEQPSGREGMPDRGSGVSR